MGHLIIVVYTLGILLVPIGLIYTGLKKWSHDSKYKNKTVQLKYLLKALLLGFVVALNALGLGHVIAG